ncbi:MAG: glycosyltransferase family 1 protein [Spirochaetes bacterium]|nr:MAG: glycosyltransferase family 1 protein [Spirochaetota bacterium]
MCTSGVGTQSRFLIHGLVATGRYSFRCLGGAIKHPNYDPIVVNPDFIIKPVDGFGDRNMIRNLLINERPDAVLLFTDPRQFMWLWEMEDEIHQVCPIAYWHVWDNDPYPAFNDVWYRSTDLINCLSHKTYELVKPHFPERTNYIPHAFPKEVYHPLPVETVKQLRSVNYKERADWFIGAWINRNATRKMPNDVLMSWKMFLDDLEKKEGHRKAMLVMHTDPQDTEGPNLFATVENLGLTGNVVFSTQKVDFNDMNALYNSVDFIVNVSKAEGFGLATLSGLMVGKPIIALKTGGMTRQVVDYRDGTEHGVAIDPACRVLVGSQMVPYIFDDHFKHEDLSAALQKVYSMSPEEKEVLAKKNIAYAEHEFGYEKMISEWDRTLDKVIKDFKSSPPKRWTCSKLNNIK